MSKATSTVVVQILPSQTTLVYIELSVSLFLNSILSNTVLLSIDTFAPFNVLSVGPSNVLKVDSDI